MERMDRRRCLSNVFKEWILQKSDPRIKQSEADFLEYPSRKQPEVVFAKKPN